MLRLSIDVTPPFDWDALIGFFAARTIPGVDQVSGKIYSRSFVLGRSRGSFALSCDTTAKLLACVACSGTPDKTGLHDSLSRLVNAAAPARKMATHLRKHERLAPLVARRPGLRVPGAWDPFELGVRAILGQQVSVAGATTLAGRIAIRFGRILKAGEPARLFPTPEVLSEADLSGLGLTTRRAATIAGFARAVCETPSLLDSSKPLDVFVGDLVSLNGFGPWTAHYMAMRLGYLDAFPASDLGVRKALNMAPEKDVLQIAEPWRPYRATAAMHLWMSLGG